MSGKEKEQFDFTEPLGVKQMPKKMRKAWRRKMKTIRLQCRAPKTDMDRFLTWFAVTSYGLLAIGYALRQSSLWGGF